MSAKDSTPTGASKVLKDHPRATAIAFGGVLLLSQGVGSVAAAGYTIAGP